MNIEQNFGQLVTMGLFLVPMVFGLVEFLKAVLPIEGKTVTLTSFFVGILYGSVIFLAFLFPNWGIYIAGGLYIVTLGLVTSGFYKFMDSHPGNKA